MGVVDVEVPLEGTSLSGTALPGTALSALFQSLSSLTSSLLSTTLSYPTLVTPSSLSSTATLSRIDRYKDMLIRERDVGRWLAERRREMEGERVRIEIVKKAIGKKKNVEVGDTATTPTTTTTTTSVRTADSIRKSIKRLRESLFEATVNDQNKLLFINKLAASYKKPVDSAEAKRSEAKRCEANRSEAKVDVEDDVKRRLRAVRDAKARKVVEMSKEIEEVRRVAGEKRKRLMSILESRKCEEGGDGMVDGDDDDDYDDDDDRRDDDGNGGNVDGEDGNDADGEFFTKPANVGRAQSKNAILRQTLLALIYESKVDWYNDKRMWTMVARLEAGDKLRD
jgi:hypothetical protein